VIDSSPASADAVREAVGARAEVRAAATLSAGLEQLRAGGWAAVVLSVDLPAADLALVRRMVESGTPAGTMVLLASRPTMQLMVEASRLGVLGVFASPPDARELGAALREVFQADDVVPLTPADLGEGDEDAAIGASPAMLEVFRMVGRVANSPATVLILGESGTGKELVATAIHRNSGRAAGPFVAINCAAIPENLLESELFGHEKGAFTGAIGRRIGRFERASGGTLFLDEIGDMSLALQSKILRALQEREIERVGGSSAVAIDVRIVAATNRDLQAAVAEGRFREDLFYRLAVVSLTLPPLRERGADLDLLASHFVAHYAREHARPVRAVAEEVFAALRAHPWPGNVRQLRNAMERAVVMSDGEVLLPQHLPPDILHPSSPRTPAQELGEMPLVTLEEMEKRMIVRALRETGDNLTMAAERLGIHRNTLRRKVAEYGIEH
jgi:two-component system, NtrC family, response regulator AtoC